MINCVLQLRHRRICRKPEPVLLSEPAVAAAAAAGLLAAPGADDDAAATGAADAAVFDNADADDAERPLPSQVVEQLLLERYSRKYERMGVPQKMPGRRKWQSLQQELRSRSPVELQPVTAPPMTAMQQAAEAAAAVGAGEAVAGAAASGQSSSSSAASEAASGTLLPPLKPGGQQ
jgi:hypothetical protein